MAESEITNDCSRQKLEFDRIQQRQLVEIVEAGFDCLMRNVTWNVMPIDVAKALVAIRALKAEE